MNIQKKIKTIYDKLLNRKEEIEIPEAWKKSEWDTPMDWLFHEEPTPEKPVEENPIARRPIFSFDIPKRDLTFLRSNLAFKAKRTIMFLLLIACLISMWSFSLVNPLSLLFYLPTTYICLDYLRKTRAKRRKVWLLLKDIEDEK